MNGEIICRSGQGKAGTREMCFWHSLSCEERECAQAALGLLEDIRDGEKEWAELAWNWILVSGL